MKTYIPTIILMLSLAGCTSIPNRFDTSESIYEGCGYTVDGLNPDGFSLEIAYTEYKFFPSPDPVILAARECFSKTATELARRKGKTITPLASGDMNTNSNRNIIDGKYLVNVTGRVRFTLK